MNKLIILITIFLIISCSTSKSQEGLIKEDVVNVGLPSFYYGADLSYVNEIEDCGARYKDSIMKKKILIKYLEERDLI